MRITPASGARTIRIGDTSTEHPDRPPCPREYMKPLMSEEDFHVTPPGVTIVDTRRPGPYHQRHPTEPSPAAHDGGSHASTRIPDDHVGRGDHPGLPRRVARAEQGADPHRYPAAAD